VFRVFFIKMEAAMLHIKIKYLGKLKATPTLHVFGMGTISQKQMLASRA
jgi:hypothetical protein